MTKNLYYQIFMVLCTCTMLLLSSCGRLEGEGGNIIYTPEVGYFTGMDIDIPCNIIITYADTLDFTVEAQQNILDNMYFGVESNKLYVELDQKVYDHNPITLTFKMPDFRELTIQDISDVSIESKIETTARMRFVVYGDADIMASDTISCFDFMYECTGNSTLDMKHLICNRNFSLSSAGDTKINMSGVSEGSSIDASGSLDFYGFDFLTKNTNITISGNANPVDIYVSEKLDVNISGDATILYKGNPQTINIVDSIGNLTISPVE